MSKQLKLNYHGTEYVLEFTRNTVRAMEAKGFVADDVTKKPATLLPELFAGAFLANHRWVKRDIVDDIFDHLTNKSELIGKLVEMYNEPLLALVDEPQENEGNVNWTASW